MNIDTKRTILPETKRATATLRKDKGCPKSYNSRGKIYLPGRAVQLDSRADIQAALNASHLRVIQFNEAGEKIADTDAEHQVRRVKPLSVKVASPADHDDSKKALSAAELIEKHERIQAEMLAEEQAAKRAKELGQPTGKPAAWNPNMSKAELGKILNEATGDDVSELKRREIISALELLEQQD